MISGQSIKLLSQHSLEINGIELQPLLYSKFPKLVRNLNFDSIELKQDDDAAKQDKLQRRLFKFIKSNQTHGDEEGKEELSAQDWMSLLTRAHYDKVELFAEPEHELMEFLCSNFPNVTMSLECKIEVSLSNTQSQPLYSKSFENYLILHYILETEKNLGRGSPLTNHLFLLNGPVLHVSMLSPFHRKKLTLILDVTLQWSKSFPRYPTHMFNSNTASIQQSGDVILNGLFDNDSDKDFTILVANGAEVKCHGFILRAHSAVLTAMISASNGMTESKTQKIEMRDIGEEAVNYFIRYLYCMQISISELNCGVALQLLQAAHKYEITHLEETIVQILLANGTPWFTPDVILELYYFVRNLESFSKLCEHSMRLLLGILDDDLPLCERYQELTSMEKDTLQWNLFKFKCNEVWKRDYKLFMKPSKSLFHS